MSCAEGLDGKSLVLWRRPLKTLKYAVLECIGILLNVGVKLLDPRLLGGLLIFVIIYCSPGPHDRYKELWRRNAVYGIYWLVLGLVSSVGFGTGLHTFLLYLGPHIADVTLAAYECQSLDFPSPPYPKKKSCPKAPYVRQLPSLWQIMAKVRIETLLWGVGTALGEIPPYFMAKAARLSNKRVQEQQALEEVERRSRNYAIFNGGKQLMERIVQRVGFFGILLCASVPNPLFDLAGVACGHFLVPFWKFFMATLIGKALFKATLQQMLVIVAFSTDLVDGFLKAIGQLPWFGRRLQVALQNLLSSTKRQMHQKIGEKSLNGFSLVAGVFQLFSIGIICYFVVSLLNALAQIHRKRMQEQEREVRIQELDNESSSSENQTVNENSQQ